MELQGKKIITIDDDIEFSKSIKNFLEDLNANVKDFANGFEAIEYIKSNPDADILLVDLRMPQIGGLEILEKIRELNINIPVVVISATNEVQTAIQAVKAGAADFLSKPIFDLDELEICISRTIQQYSDKKELEEYRSGLEKLVMQKTEELTRTNIELNVQIERTKIAEKKAKLGSQNYIDAVDETVKQISKELHDSVGQKLTLAKINLDILSKKLDGSNENLDTAVKSIEEIGNDIKGLVRKLYPQSIEKYSLEKNLESLVNSFDVIENVEINFECINCERLVSKELKLDIFRIFQESLNNIFKHSHADKIDLLADMSGNKIKILIKDNGTGFDLNATEEKRGAGLFTMQERVGKYKGNFNLESNPGKGTSIKIEINL